MCSRGFFRRLCGKEELWEYVSEFFEAANLVLCGLGGGFRVARFDEMHGFPAAGVCIAAV